MKLLKLILPIMILCVYFSRSYADPAQDERLLKEVAFSSLNEVHIIGVDIDGDKNLRWAAWSEVNGQGTSVKLALLANTQNGPAIVTLLNRKDAYEPAIMRIPNWRHGKHPIMVLTYRRGAEAEQIELYGIDNENTPVQLDNSLGEQIEWRIGKKGQAILSVYSKPRGQLVATCYEWQEEKKKLSRIACPR